MMDWNMIWLWEERMHGERSPCFCRCGRIHLVFFVMAIASYPWSSATGHFIKDAPQQTIASHQESNRCPTAHKRHLRSNIQPSGTCRTGEWDGSEGHLVLAFRNFVVWRRESMPEGASQYNKRLSPCCRWRECASWVYVRFKCVHLLLWKCLRTLIKTEVFVVTDKTKMWWWCTHGHVLETYFAPDLCKHLRKLSKLCCLSFVLLGFCVQDKIDSESVWAEKSCVVATKHVCHHV